MSDVLTDAVNCSLCPKMCRFSCPVTQATADEAATPTAMMQTWMQAREGRLSWAAAAEAFSRCTGCEACRVPCEFDTDVPGLLYRARAEAWTREAVPEHTRALLETCRSTGNPFGIDPKTLLVQHARRRDFDKTGRVLYWPGCRSLAEEPERIPHTMALLRAVGADHVSLPATRGPVSCCGAPFRVAGDATGFVAAADGNQPYFDRQRTIVTPCSQCLTTIGQGYAEIGIEVHAELVHVGEYLLYFRDRIADLGRRAMELARPPLPTVLVHDSCGLHRRLGRAAPVHEIIEAATGVRPESWAPDPGRTSCCGGGDFHDLRRPAAAAEVARWALRDRTLLPGTRVVTGDRTCLTSLRGGLPDAVRADDLVGFLLDWLAPALDELGA